MGTFYQFSRPNGRFLEIFPAAHQFFSAMEKVIWDGVFHSRLEDKAHALQVFKEHIEEVKRLVPEERLLIFEARQGWEPLCACLNGPVPANKPYPHKHRGAPIRKVLKYRMVLKGSALIAVMLLLYALVHTFVV